MSNANLSEVFARFNTGGRIFDTIPASAQSRQNKEGENMSEVGYPLDEDGNPKVHISILEKNTINIGNYSNVIIEARISRFVKEGTEEEELNASHSELQKVLDPKRDEILSEVG
jgi:hypothetical protein